MLLLLLLPIPLPQLATAEQASHSAIAVEGSADTPPGIARSSLTRERPYTAYLSPYKDAKRPHAEIVLQAGHASRLEGEGFKKLADYEGMAGESLLTAESGYAEWTFDVERADSIISAFSTILSKERARPLSVPYTWTVNVLSTKPDSCSSTESGTMDPPESCDNRGNDLRPNQAEAPRWNEEPFQDSDGYRNEPFLFYFTSGSHSIKLESTREPMVIRQLKLFQQPSPPMYSEWIAQQEGSGAKATSGHLITVEGENATAKSSPTLYPLSDAPAQQSLLTAAPKSGSTLLGA